MMFRREHHQAVAAVLNAFNPDYFRTRHCYFGGGTLLALDLGEHRESVDIDFLISDPDQIRALRQDLYKNGYAPLFAEADPGMTLTPDRPKVSRDKVVFAAQPHDSPIKVEIIFEGRIALDDPRNVSFTAMPCLAVRDSIAEKLLANADRGMDSAYFSKDLIDLAVVVTETELLDTAIEKVHTSGNRYDVVAPLRRATEYFSANPDYRHQCYDQLQVSSPNEIVDGVDRLTTFLGLPAIDRLVEEEAELY